MTYQETLDYMYSSLPMFHRIGTAAYKKDLYNTIRLCEYIGNPQDKFKSVHVAGTNGKGSTSHMLASILQKAGYKVGLYTSPHLKNFTERIKINGEPIPEESVVEYIKQNRAHLDEIQPSFFEMTVAMAFDYFAKEAIDIAVVEVGLGGRLDSTNIITPILSVITNISYDHQSILGNTLKEIASEKAGIIKPSVPAVVSERQEEVAEVFIDKVNEVNASLYFASDDYIIKEYSLEEGRLKACYINQATGNELTVYSELTGLYQLQNIRGVLQAATILQGLLTISDDDIKEGIANAVTSTGLKGRWQQLQTNPLVICDTGHNEEGITKVVAQLQSIPHRQLHIVIGVVNDKDITKVLKLLPRNARYYFTHAHIPRALDAYSLQEKAKEFSLNGEAAENVNLALELARKNAAADDLIFVGGSTFVVAELDEL